jgi:hypothetical protein
VTVIANRDRLVAALGGRRADTLTHCPQCGKPARFKYGSSDGGHEIAGWIYEKPLLSCPHAPAGRFLSVTGDLVTVAVNARQVDEPAPAQRWEQAAGE